MAEKILRYALIAFFVIASIVTITFISNGVPAIDTAMEATTSENSTQTAENLEVDSLNTFLSMATWLIIITAIVALVSQTYGFVKQLMDSPKSAIATLVGIAALGIVVLISYSIASDAVTPIFGYTGDANTPYWSKITDTMLFTMYTLVALAVVSMLYSQVNKLKR